MTIPAERFDRIWVNCRLATGADPSSTAEPEGTFHALTVRGGKFAMIRATSGIPSGATGSEVIDARGAWVTPGLIDCHTHLVWAGRRTEEIALRFSGVSYSEIARRGGGILSTVRATRAASEEMLVEQSLPRLRALMAEGATTIEIKSGYGLTLADEIKMLRAARKLGTVEKVNIHATLLAAHAVPPEYTGRPDEYVSFICDEIIPAVAGEGLADSVDVFCEHIAFTVPQCERVFRAAQAHGLPVRGHMEQLSNMSGAQLAARFKALSVDHLEHLAAAGVEAIARSGTVAVLLPGAFYFLRETQKPPVAALRAAGVPMAVATDLNPGTSPFASIRWMMNMSCVLFGLTPAEALAGVTQHAARALGLSAEAGRIAIGMSADFLVWETGPPATLACEAGVNFIRHRVFKGELA